MTAFETGNELKLQAWSFIFVGTRGHHRIRMLVALAACGLILTAPFARAQDRRGIDQADRVSQSLLNAHNKQRAGDNYAARAILLDALSDVPDSASLLDAFGSVEQDLGKYVEAERSYLSALSVSGRTAGSPERISILQNLGTLYLDTNQFSKGERVREQLEQSWLGTIDDHPAEAAKLLNVIGSLEHARNRDDEAERYYSRSLLLLRQVQGPASVDAALVEANMGFLKLGDQQYASAAVFFQQAVGEIEVASGHEDPALIRPLIDLAICENMRGHAKEAEAPARRAVELSSKTFGEAHVQTASAMLEEAIALRSLGRKKLARDIETQAKTYLRNNPAIRSAAFTVNVRDLEASTTR